MLSAMVMRKFYRQADGDPTRLPWHRLDPGQTLVATAAEHPGGRALDVGCGAGVFSVWMAQQGLEVTGLDLFPEAIAMGRAHAAQAGVEPRFVCGDLFGYAPPQRFDLIVDSGCLHSLVGGNLVAYKRQILRWLSVGGEYVLGHWGKRHALDWRPIGPRRRSQRAIERLFGDALTLVDAQVQDFATPLPFGPVVRGVSYRFRRPPGESASPGASGVLAS